MIAALLDHLWQSTLFCGGVWVVARLCRANAAALRHGLWLVASMKFLVPFAALYGLGTLAGLPAPSGGDASFFDQAVQAAAPMVSPTSALRVAAPGSGAALAITLSVVWLLGAAIVARRWLLAWRAAVRVMGTARSAPDAPPDARVTDADIEPAAAGTFHPVVLLPAALLGRLTGTQLHAVLTHEREHIRRYDNLKANAHRLVEVLFWFHPAVWWIGRQMIEERERACDEAVLDHGHDGAVYAAGILEVCRHCIGRSRRQFSVGVLSGNLTGRVRHILAGARPAAIGIAKGYALLLAALACAGIPLVTGATDDALRRHALLSVNTRSLAGARFSVAAAAASTDGRPAVVANEREVLIRNSSLREMVALSFGMQGWQVRGDGEWLDSPRYDVRVEAPEALRDPANLDPNALRNVVTQLLADRFDLEVYVNQRCQGRCGRPTSTGKQSTD